MRQHQERSVSDGTDHQIGHILRAHHGTGTGNGGTGHLSLRVRRVGHGAQQWGVHAHRAHAAHADSPVAVGDGQPLREPDGGMLGHAVGRRTQLRQQACG